MLADVLRAQGAALQNESASPTRSCRCRGVSERFTRSICTTVLAVPDDIYSSSKSGPRSATTARTGTLRASCSSALKLWRCVHAMAGTPVAMRALDNSYLAQVLGPCRAPSAAPRAITAPAHPHNETCADSSTTLCLLMLSMLGKLLPNIKPKHMHLPSHACGPATLLDVLPGPCCWVMPPRALWPHLQLQKAQHLRVAQCAILS